MNPFKRMMQRLGLQRVSPRGRRELLQPHEDDNGGDASAGGVPARLPKVPPRLGPGYAQAIPREEKMADQVAGAA
jgi:hypothetical protein